MKKMTVLALLIGSTLAAAPAVHALDVTGLTIAITVEAGVETSAVIVAPTFSTTAVVDGEDKAAYFAQLREDAVQQIAEGGAPTAVLADAIRQIREQTGTKASDYELAREIVKAIR